MAQLNHIGIAVRSPATLEKLFHVLGLRVDHSEVVPEQSVRTHFLPLPIVRTSIELLEPLESDGAVAKFLEQRGPGVHHLSFEVSAGTLESTCERLRESGYRLIYPEPKKGAHGMRINFIHPSSAGGILIELMEPASSGDSP